MFVLSIRRLLRLGLGMLFACAGLALAADKPDTPVTAKGFEIVTPEQAQALIGKAAFFDMRSAINFGKGNSRAPGRCPTAKRAISRRASTRARTSST
jgi:hypothetical protein